MNSPQEQFARDVVAKLLAAGHVALWAGGCVRDQLLGTTPKDYDVATSATPDEVRQVFGRRRTIPVGASFGVMTVLGPKQAGQIEVATFRTDGGYSDGRHPDQVEFSTPEHDAQRRDFTINGLFYDPQADEVHDFVGGQTDLEAGIIRAIGNPEARIAEDKLRMLRAVRFAARFDFAIDRETLQAVQHHAGEITQVSGERIGAEMRAMLVHLNRAEAVMLLRTTGLEPFVLPETVELTGKGWEELSVLLNRLEGASCEPTFALVLATVLSQLGEVRACNSISKRWKLAGRDSERADWLLDHLSIALAADQTPWPKLQRVLINEGAAELVDLAAARVGNDASSVVLCREKLSLPAEELNPPPLVTGGDLIAAGLEPGPRFGELLERIRDAQLEGTITTRDEALAMAK